MTTRIDRWLWAVRLAKTRSAATALCRGGHVRLNGAPVKPSAAVRVGDVVEARIAGRDRVVDVVEVIEFRVGAPRAAECLVDRSPEPPPPVVQGRRDPGSGKPTKRERRELDRLRGRRR